MPLHTDVTVSYLMNSNQSSPNLFFIEDYKIGKGFVICPFPLLAELRREMNWLLEFCDGRGYVSPNRTTQLWILSKRFCLKT